MGAVAYTATINKRSLHKSSFPCPAASSFDAELSAVHAALDWLVATDNLTSHIYLLIDNIACLRSCLDTDIKTNQMAAIRINILMRHIFETSDATIHLCYCPSHVGIKGNEIADQLAKSHYKDSSILLITRQNFITRSKLDNSLAWQIKAQSSSYRGKQWLEIKCNKKRFKPKIGSKSKTFFVDLIDNQMVDMSRLTRCITNHAPTGEFNARFFPNKSVTCNFCESKIQTQAHILTECNYVSSFISLPHFLRHPNNDKMLKSFLKDNIYAFTFDDLPYDVP